MVPSPLTQVGDKLQRAAFFDGAELPGDGVLLDRFLDHRDGSAFELLVRRHGPMVLGVCQRILGQTPDVDDAFQATFIVLFKKGDSVRPRDQVGPWLYGVARRVSLKARGLVARHHQRERPMIDKPVESAPAFEQRDWLPLLDCELNRLPEKYRSVVILCDLQGQSRREAATRLRLSEGTLSSRLARARALLGDRLKRRGVVLSAAMLAFSQSASAATPPTLVASTCGTVSSVASGTSIAANLSVLSQGVIQAMVIKKFVSYVSVAFVAVSMSMGLGTGYFLHQAYADKPAKPAAEADKPKPEKPSAEKPAKPAASDALVGQVKSVADDKKSLTLMTRVPGTKETKEETLPLDKDVAVEIVKSKKEIIPGKIDDVAAGSIVAIEMTADKKGIAKIRVNGQKPDGEKPAAGETFDGQVKALAGDKKSVTLLVRVPGTKETKEKTVSLDKDVSVILVHGGKKETKPGKVDDLTVGSAVNVSLTADKTAIASIRISGGSLGGMIKSVDPAKNTITIVFKDETGLAEKTIELMDDARVILNDGFGTKTNPVPPKECKLGDLTDGLVVRIQLSGYDRAKAIGVDASGPTVGGTVEAIDVAKNTITISSKGQGEQTFSISKDVKIFGKDKLADINNGSGASLRLSVEDKKTVVGISVSDK